MKHNIFKIVVFFIFITLYNKSYSQDIVYLKLNYKDFEYLIEHNIEEADTYLSKKNFEFQTVNKSQNCDATVWSFKRDIKNDASVAFISKNCSEANTGFIWFQSSDKRIYDSIKEQCKIMGFKYSRSDTNDFNQLCLYYEGTKYKIKFCSGMHPNSNKNVYIIVLDSNN
jgi:hypothetical protein